MSRLAKQVRFASQHVVYPSEKSISAIAVPFSTPGARTKGGVLRKRGSSKTYGFPRPISPVLACNPYAKLPELVKYTNRAGSHPLLEKSAIKYDLRDPVSTATVTTDNNRSLSIETLHQSAFIPPLSRITITSQYLPWIIKVYASNEPYITVKDILTSLYAAFRTNITSTEFQLLPSHHHRQRATSAYQQRYRRLRHQIRSEMSDGVEASEASQLEKCAGMKRVDFLMGHTKFLGISSKGHHSNEWNLHVAS